MSALDRQEGGDHYKKLKIQPIEYSMANGLDACQHTVIKYVTRFRDKGGVDDLRKAIHCIELLIEFEGRTQVIEKEGTAGPGISLSDFADGWSPWSYDHMPPMPNCLVEVRLANGICGKGPASFFVWDKPKYERNVVAYRVVPA